MTLNVQYRGRRGKIVEPRTRVVGVDGYGRVTPLHHVVRHSPTGFEWGYGGSGPADLARSLIIDALRDEALCTRCPDGQHDAWRGYCDGDGYRLAVQRSYQPFKSVFVATWSDEWQFERDVIVDFVREIDKLVTV